MQRRIYIRNSEDGMMRCSFIQEYFSLLIVPHRFQIKINLTYDLRTKRRCCENGWTSSDSECRRRGFILIHNIKEIFEVYIFYVMSLQETDDHGSPHIPIFYYLWIFMTSWKDSGVFSRCVFHGFKFRILSPRLAITQCCKVHSTLLVEKQMDSCLFKEIFCESERNRLD